MNRLIQTAAAILYIASSFKFTYAQDEDDGNSNSSKPCTTRACSVVFYVVLFLCQWFAAIMIEQSLKLI